MRVVETLAEARARQSGQGRVGLVPTMGFFHEGHLSLMEQSRAECDLTVVTIYVNPLQFEDPSDLARYPANHRRDLDLAEELGVDLVVAPTPDEMFARPPLTKVSVAGLEDRLEGEYRPGHISGVATVVVKLLAALRPDRAYFGRKDAQQLVMVERVVQDLSLPVRVVGCRLVRENQGLALSSRNVLLQEQRAAALSLSRGLMSAADKFDQGERRAAVLEAEVRREVAGEALEYVRLCEASTLTPVNSLDGEGYLPAAARFGSVRIIDNIYLESSEPGAVADRGLRLDHPSLLYSDSEIGSHVPSS
ncbi:MAG: pantoate--beta-alanine ligase [Acidimicrobiia bacterium]|nr:pantoate--beta-alanine ligase [Acidimicrobiia bacterium]MYD03871.1 pantoate--beta-alanine ligase [Acidimicrobiia bacterium]